MGRPHASDKHYDDLITYVCKNCSSQFQAMRFRRRKVCSLSCNAKWNLKNKDFGAKSGCLRRGDPSSWKHSEEFKTGRRLSGNPNWRGKRVNHHSLHSWIKKNWIKNPVCELCATISAPVYDWSNKDHKYSRDRADWWVLCRSCHQKYDYKYLGRGTRGTCSTERVTHTTRIDK